MEKTFKQKQETVYGGVTTGIAPTVTPEQSTRQQERHESQVQSDNFEDSGESHDRQSQQSSVPDAEVNGD